MKNKSIFKLKKIISMLTVIAMSSSMLTPVVNAETTTAIPICMEFQKFDATTVAGDSAKTLLWSKGAATTTAGSLQLVSAKRYLTSATVRRNPVTLKSGFSTYFVINMNGSTSTSPADGLMFILQSNPTPQLGTYGAGLGFDKVPNSVGVEFDIFRNTDVDSATSKTYYDPANPSTVSGHSSSNYVAIVQNGDNTHAAANNDVIDNALDFNLYGGASDLSSNDINVWVDYDGTNLTAYYGKSKTKLSNRGITKNIGSVFQNKDIYVGFSASTGGSTSVQEVKQWYFSDNYVAGGLSSTAGTYTQGANSTNIVLNSTSTNPSTASITVQDILNANMTSQNAGIYIDGIDKGTVNTGVSGTGTYTFDYSSLSVGDHTIKAVAASGGTSSSTTFTVTKDTTKPVITLLGNASETVVNGVAYVDAGAKAADKEDGDITGKIIVTITDGSGAEVTAKDRTVAGTYTYHYNVSDTAGNAATEVTRTVTVQAAKDTTKPVITLVGNASETVVNGVAYADAGAKAADKEDGDITGKIVVTITDGSGAEVTAKDRTVAGTYTYHYNVSDTAGNAATEVTRTVTVQAAKDTTKPVITLVGNASETVVNGSAYTDAAATAADKEDGDITKNIVTTITNGSGAAVTTIDTTVAGTYTYHYNVSDTAGNAATEVTRTVIVQAKIVAVTDTTKPVITLVGNATETLANGATYKDAAATATDKEDGDITKKIVTTVTTGSGITVIAIDTTVAGTYTYHYNVSDTAGNAATEVTRTVIILSPESYSSGGSSGTSTNDTSETVSTPTVVTPIVVAPVLAPVLDATPIVTNVESVGLKRIAGGTRVDTAIELAKAEYTGKVKSIVFAVADNFPDALTGTVLAYKEKAPILLVGSTQGEQDKVLTYMKNYMDIDGTVFLLGGTGVVTEDFANQVKSAGYIKVIRLGGIDRYETAAKITEYLNVAEGTPIVIASGENYPDALSASSPAAINQYPILLVNKNEISDSVKDELAKIKPSSVNIIGEQGAVSGQVENQLTLIVGNNIVRLGGLDRYSTSIAVASYFKPSGKSACITTGNDFPDALAGSIYGAIYNAPVILVGNMLTDEAKAYFQNSKLAGITIFGGEGAVSTEVQNEVSGMLSK